MLTESLLTPPSPFVDSPSVLTRHMELGPGHRGVNRYYMVILPYLLILFKFYYFFM